MEKDHTIEGFEDSYWGWDSSEAKGKEPRGSTELLPGPAKADPWWQNLGDGYGAYGPGYPNRSNAGGGTGERESGRIDPVGEMFLKHGEIPQGDSGSEDTLLGFETMEDQSLRILGYPWIREEPKGSRRGRKWSVCYDGSKWKRPILRRIPRSGARGHRRLFRMDPVDIAPADAGQVPDESEHERWIRGVETDEDMDYVELRSGRLVPKSKMFVEGLGKTTDGGDEIRDRDVTK